ncbi:MAG TPA: protein kinase [Kofleriaceae bacterium]|nr:protein kinase [Kofleriaceae bacterium]
MGCPDADTFNTLVAGKLDSAARAALADHAASCPDCHGLLGELLDLTESAPAAQPASAPAQVDRYVIERRLGAGAMGVVYAARDPELERPVAIKVLRGGASAARLKREAQMLARLHHPNVVAVYDVGDHAGQTFVAMALVDGANLRDWLAAPHTTDDIMRVLRDVARGLGAAHAAEVIHRDLKPDNIFVANDGSVQVGDFGLARSDGDLDPSASASLGMELTQTGMVLGTPAYMAPEHAAGQATAASDQFSFCVTAWEALFGVRPFTATTYAELHAKIVARELAVPAEPRRVPARVRAALERGLRAEPGDRFPSIDALAAELAPPRRRWPWVAGGLAVAAGAAALAVSLAAPRDRAAACESTAHELDAVWSPAARDRLDPGAQHLVDGYVRDWLALRHDACVDARGAAADPRNRCLDRAHDALARLLAQVAPGSDPDRLHAAVLALPPIADCRNPLEDTTSVAVRAAGEQLLARISDANVRSALSGASVMPELEALDAEAHGLGFAPAIIDAARAEASALDRVGERARAADVLRPALAAAEASRDDLRVAQVASELAALAEDKPDEASTMITLAEGAVARIGNDPDIALVIGFARIKLASASGDHAKAIETAQALIAPTIARTGADSLEVSELYVALAREYSATGRSDQAHEALAKARFTDLSRAKSGHVLDVVALSAKITDAFTQGDAERAISLARQLLALAGEGHDPAIEIEAAVSLARAYELAEDSRMMIDAFGDVLARLDAHPDAAGVETRAEALEAIGTSWIALGQPARAIEPLRRALAIETAGGATLFDYKTSTTNALADALVTTGKPREARALIEPMLKAMIDNPDVLPQRRAGAELVLARALWDDGDDHERARARTLAGDAALHYRQAIARLTAGGLARIVPMIQRRLDAVTTWQQRHP